MHKHPAVFLSSLADFAHHINLGDYVRTEDGLEHIMDALAINIGKHSGNANAWFVVGDNRVVANSGHIVVA